MLDNGLVLLESERDSQGNYKAGAGMDGMIFTDRAHFLSRSGIRMGKSSRFWNASRSASVRKTWSP